MTKRLAVALVVFILTLPSFAKDKKPQLSPFILRATRVAVVYEGSAPLPDLRAGANYDARAAVEQALRKWGRFTVMLQTSPTDYPDLVIGIRKGGGAVRPTVAGGSRNERPPISISDSSISLGTSVGQRAPARGTAMEMGPSDDMFSVYVGGTASGPLLWRYSGRNALDAPAVRAVQEFRKIIEAAEKAERDAQKAP